MPNKEQRQVRQDDRDAMPPPTQEQPEAAQEPIIIEFCGVEANADDATQVNILLLVNGKDNILSAPLLNFMPLVPPAPVNEEQVMIADYNRMKDELARLKRDQCATAIQFKGILNFLNDPANSANQKRTMVQRELAKP